MLCLMQRLYFATILGNFGRKDPTNRDTIRKRECVYATSNTNAQVSKGNEMNITYPMAQCVGWQSDWKNSTKTAMPNAREPQ